MENELLTLDKLKAMKPGEIFANGLTTNSPDGLYMTDENLNGELRWLAKRGDGYHDWAIYSFWSTHDLDWIMQHGQKVSNENNIKKLVACEDAAFELYRR